MLIVIVTNLITSMTMILIIVKLKHKQERKTAMDNNLVRNASAV